MRDPQMPAREYTWKEMVAFLQALGIEGEFVEKVREVTVGVTTLEVHRLYTEDGRIQMDPETRDVIDITDYYYITGGPASDVWKSRVTEGEPVRA